MGVAFYVTMSLGITHVILKTTTRTRTLKGGGFGLTMSNVTTEVLTLSFGHHAMATRGQ